jgi:membrane-bound lytic murein transglycosylase F
MMMLTEDTADYLRVKNRLDAQESIRAGARYLAELVEQVPDSAKFPDRLWLALSAYNLGMGHFRGARAIAQKMKRDPDVWYEMKQVLPLLARPEIYARLKSGAARGGEAVIMVENIRNYYDILTRFEAAHISPYAAAAPFRPR